MRGTIKTFETANNTYYIGYGKTAKTSYEQQQEQREEFRYMVLQKTVGSALTAFSIGMLAFGIIPGVLPLIMGIAVVMSKEHVIG